MLKKIMFPTDFSLASNKIIDCLPTFKPLGLKEAVIVHIVDERDDRDLIQRTKWAEDAMEKYKNTFEGCGVKIKTIVKTGVPFIELNETADKEDVSLVIITSHGKSKIEKMLLGSVTEKFLYHCNKPVLIEKVTVFEDYTKQECKNFICKNTFNHILYPTDWSKCSQDVLKEIINFKKIGTEEVTVLHVMDERHLRYRTEKDKEEYEKEDNKKLAKAKKQLEKEGFKVNTILAKGSPFKEIKRVAMDGDITLITMGIHGKSFIKEVMIGSTAERVVKFAYKPVLLLSHREN